MFNSDAKNIYNDVDISGHRFITMNLYVLDNNKLYQMVIIPKTKLIDNSLSISEYKIEYDESDMQSRTEVSYNQFIDAISPIDNDRKKQAVIALRGFKVKDITNE
jgi:hypothetical protein